MEFESNHHRVQLGDLPRFLYPIIIIIIIIITIQRNIDIDIDR